MRKLQLTVVDGEPCPSISLDRTENTELGIVLRQRDRPATRAGTFDPGEAVTVVLGLGADTTVIRFPATAGALVGLFFADALASAMTALEPRVYNYVVRGQTSGRVYGQPGRCLIRTSPA